MAGIIFVPAEKAQDVRLGEVPSLHHTSIIHVYEVFEHLHMLWNGIYVHPYLEMTYQGLLRLVYQYTNKIYQLRSNLILI